MQAVGDGLDVVVMVVEHFEGVEQFPGVVGPDERLEQFAHGAVGAHPGADDAIGANGLPTGNRTVFRFYCSGLGCNGGVPVGARQFGDGGDAFGNTGEEPFAGLVAGHADTRGGS